MKRRLLSIVLILMLTLSSFSAFAEEEKVDLELIEQIINYIEAYHYYDVDRETLIQGAYEGILNTLDAHSTYFNERDYNKFITDLDGEFIGVGIYIEAYEGYIKVISPIKGMPGDLAGLKSGDLITHVDGKPTKDYAFDLAIDLILGEAGTKVVLTINRGGEVFDVEIIREKIVIPDVEFEMLEDNIGYLRIVQFGASVAKEVNDAMVELNQQGMTSIIVDLRNNPGGYLNQVVQVADWFVEKGDPILHVDYKAQSDENYYAQLSALNIPTAVLVNEGTASASEILAGAIKNNNEGIVIGKTTYGKGTVQNLLPLKDGSAIKLTTAEYLAAHNQPVNGIGIVPDMIIEDKSNLSNKFVDFMDNAVTYYKKNSSDVFAAQQRLSQMGYDVNITGLFDEKMLEAMMVLKEKYDLSAPILNTSYKNQIEKAYETFIEEEDEALDQAIDWIKGQFK